MPNPFNVIGGKNPMGNMGQMIQQLNQFRQSFQGDPKQKVQEMLNNGTITQSQLNQFQQQAKQIQQMIGKL